MKSEFDIDNGAFGDDEDSQIAQWRENRLKRLEQFSQELDSLGTRHEGNGRHKYSVESEAIQHYIGDNFVKQDPIDFYRHEQQLSQETYQLSLSNSRNQLQMPS